MYKETYDGTLAVCVGICNALVHTHTLGEAGRNVVTVLDSMPWIDRKSRAEIKLAAEALTRSLMMEGRNAIGPSMSRRFRYVMQAFNRAYKRRWVSTKKNFVVATMDVNRRRDEPIVFYLVSKHQKPQKAHEPLQGTVLVDRFWRKALTGMPVLDDVGRYVERNGTMTVQRAMEGPHWLITRVNCRHYLIPIDTATVLSTDVDGLNKRFQKHPSGIRRPLTDPQRYAAYVQLRNAIRARCNNIVRRAM